MIQLVQSYYEFMETQTNQSIYHSRKLLDNIDVDRTMQQMLIFFQKKYMPDLPVNDNNIRFIVKNIGDLYRRKGSEEGIHLFFRMFYNTSVEVYYPSFDMIKPSSSVWKVGNFIQLYPVSDPLAFNDLLGRKIYGSLSKAEAYVDGIQFMNVYGSSIPVVMLDKTRGRFIGLETIFVIEPERKNYGKIYGSLEQILNVNGSTANNVIGDIVELHSSKGYGGKAIVTDVSDTISGEITFKIEDGDFGYTVSANTELILSNQSITINNPNLAFVPEERVGQNKGANNWVYGTVIGQNSTTVGIKLDNPNDEADWFEQIYPIETIDRDVNISFSILYAGLGQPDVDAASANVVAITNTIEVDIVTDIIEDYLDVQMGPGTNYNDSPAEQPMSGNTDPINLSTRLIDAFGPQKITIGTISALGNIVTGDNYENSLFALVKENRIMRFDIKDQIIGYNAALTPVSILRDDIIVQSREIINFEGNTVIVSVRGKVIDIRNDALYIKPRSFYDFIIPFDANTQIYKDGTSVPISVSSISRDQSSNPMGYNAIISATADFELGRIESVKVINSGVAYQDGAAIEMRNISRTTSANSSNPDGTGVALARGQGITEGKWVSKTSHLNYADGKRIQDSNFYQDFSYEVATSLAEDEFISQLKDVAHPAGIKLFTKFSLLESINMGVTITSEITQQDANI